MRRAMGVKPVPAAIKQRFVTSRRGRRLKVPSGPLTATRSPRRVNASLLQQFPSSNQNSEHYLLFDGELVALLCHTWKCTHWFFHCTFVCYRLRERSHWTSSMFPPWELLPECDSPTLRLLRCGVNAPPGQTLIMRQRSDSCDPFLEAAGNMCSTGVYGLTTSTSACR